MERGLSVVVVMTTQPSCLIEVSQGSLHRGGRGWVGEYVEICLLNTNLKFNLSKRKFSFLTKLTPAPEFPSLINGASKIWVFSLLHHIHLDHKSDLFSSHKMTVSFSSLPFSLPLPSVSPYFQNVGDMAGSLLWYPWAYHFPFTIHPACHYLIHLLSDTRIDGV